MSVEATTSPVETEEHFEEGIDIITWTQEGEELNLTGMTVPAGTFTWVQAAVQVLPSDGTEMHIDDVLNGIIEKRLRDTTSVKTPIQTLRRDLNVESRRTTARVRNTRRGWYARKT